MKTTFSLWKIATLLCGLLLISLVSGCSDPKPQFKGPLRILSWDGYTDDVVVKEFENRFGVKVEVTYANSDDELWEMANANDGKNFDVFAVNTSELVRYIDKGVSVPIDLTLIPNHSAQLPRFKDLKQIAGLSRNNNVYAIPYAFSEMGLIYNKKTVTEIPDSMAAMWDSRYQGKVLAYNASAHNFSLTALMMGIENPFKLSVDQLRAVGSKLVDLRRNIMGFYNTAEEATKLFHDHEVALIYANYGTQQVADLKKSGADIGYIVPREGALAWLDCWSITKNAIDPKLAATWINYSLEKGVSERLTSAHGLANTIVPFPDAKAEDRIVWLQPIENVELRKEMWDKIIAGENL